MERVFDYHRKDEDKAGPYKEAIEAWWEIANQGQLRSCSVLDMLSRLEMCLSNTLL